MTSQDTVPGGLLSDGPVIQTGVTLAAGATNRDSRDAFTLPERTTAQGKEVEDRGRAPACGTVRRGNHSVASRTFPTRRTIRCHCSADERIYSTPLLSGLLTSNWSLVSGNIMRRLWVTSRPAVSRGSLGGACE